MEIASQLSEETKQATLRQMERLKDLNAQALNLLPDVGGDITFLCSETQLSTSARALKSCGLIVIAEDFMIQAPSQILMTVAIHELTHVRISRILRHTIGQRHKDIDGLFHGNILADWLLNKIELWSPQNYFDHKGWRHLYDGFLGPTQVEFHEAADAINGYFELLERGLVFLEGREIETISLISSPDSTFLPITNQYAEDPQATAVKILTGYELAQYLIGCINSTLCHSSGLDLDILEEGFANYVSTSLTKVSFKDLQHWAPQDAIKIKVAEKIKDRYLGVEEALLHINGYDDLIKLGSIQI